jgi:hypothetical protein
VTVKTRTFVPEAQPGRGSEDVIQEAFTPLAVTFDAGT